MEERRSAARIPYAGDVEYPMSDSALGKMTNITTQGIAFVGPRPVDVGEMLELVLMNRNVVVKGSVRHVLSRDDDGFRIGVQFARDEEDLVSVLLESGG